jgi:hypothetical protein
LLLRHHTKANAYNTSKGFDLILNSSMETDLILYRLIMMTASYNLVTFSTLPIFKNIGKETGFTSFHRRLRSLMMSSIGLYFLSLINC